MSTKLDKINNNHTDISVLSENLCYLMQYHRIDTNELFKRTGIAVTTINTLKKGIGNPTYSTLHQLANFFNVSIGQLTESQLTISSTSSRQCTIPLISVEEVQSFITHHQFKYSISTDIESSEADLYFAVKINNSMSPVFEKGSVFVIAHNILAHDGDIVLVQFNNQTPCFRKIFIEGSSYLLKSICDIKFDHMINTNELIIHGVVIKAIQHFHY